MTNPNTPREDQVEGLFNTLDTESQETLTAARGAIDRQAAIIADLKTTNDGLQAGQVDEETLAAFTDRVNALVAISNEAQDAFSKVGVPETEVPPVEEIVAGTKKKGKGRK